MIPHDFHFLRPEWLFAILPLAPLLWWAWRKQGLGAGWERVCEPHLLRHLLTTPGRQSLRWPFALFAIGWISACLALAGPAWERLPQTAFKEPARTVFVLGLSPSMNQRDIAPSRLARARHKLLDALEERKGGSFALVLYREEAYAAAPLTDDAEVLREMIPLLDTTLTPGRRVLPARGLETAAALLEPVGLSGARILLVTDGADDDPAATRRAAQDLASRGAHLSVLSIAGEDASLATLASAGNGAYSVLTADGSDLAKLLAEHGVDFGTSFAKSEIQTDEWRDMGVWLVWIPLLLAPLAFRKGWASAILLIAFLQLPTSTAEAGVRDWFERPDQRASHAFEAEDYEAAARSFEDPRWRAAAHYRAGDFEAAAKALEGRTDPASQYNRANALARNGQLEEALAAYDQALAQTPEDEDARFNRDLVAKLLEEQKNRQPDQQARQNPQDSSDSKNSADSSDGSNASGSSQENQNQNQNDSGQNQDGRPKGDQGDAERNTEDPSPDGSSTSPKHPDPGKGTGSESSPAPDRTPGKDRADGDESASGPEDVPDDARTPAMASDDRPQQPGEARTPGSTSQPMSAREQDMARWMGRLPDDPAGLLREKIRRDYLRKQEMRRKGAQP